MPVQSAAASLERLLIAPPCCRGDLRDVIAIVERPIASGTSGKSK
jgi:hypothetical protein